MSGLMTEKNMIVPTIFENKIFEKESYFEFQNTQTSLNAHRITKSCFFLLKVNFLHKHFSYVDQLSYFFSTFSKIVENSNILVEFCQKMLYETMSLIMTRYTSVLRGLFITWFKYCAVF